MIDAANLLYRIKECPHDDTLYLLEKISNGGGFFALNGNFLYMVPNTEACTSQNIKTEYLRLQTSTHISAFNVSTPSFGNGYYNFIELFIAEKDNCVENISAFVNLCVSYAVNSDEIDFISFFDSLVKIFQLPPEQQYKNLIGLYGELSVIKFFFENFREDLSLYWHTEGVNSKIDIVTPYISIEVKTTPSNLFVFKLKHSQLFDNTSKTYLAAVSISENNSGESLNELVEEMLNHTEYCNSFSFALNLEAEKRRISPREAESRRFQIKNIKLYSAKDICPFPVIPDIISDLSYKIDLSGFVSEDIQAVIKKERASN
ncbi:MAG: PD-(D/E)XK motif protein [Salinivirgaceae bacterium]|nr:PD-(D/E)XK motif protein [Salinivirgaceae bacterium]